MNELYERKILNKVRKWLNKPEIIVLLGARQVGKTSILKLLMDDMKDKQFIYFDLENTYNLELFSNTEFFLNYLRGKDLLKSKKLYIFIDDFQYMQDTTKFLKLMYDGYPNLKFIVTGSSSLEIKRNFSESLTGRKIILKIHSLDFEEFLLFKESDLLSIKQKINIRKIAEDFSIAEELSIFTKKINVFLNEFIVYGGYPKPVLTPDIDDKILRLKEIHNSYIKKDIKDIGKIDNILEFNKLVSVLALNNGNQFNVKNITEEFGIKRRHIEKYIDLLKETFVINILKPYFRNKKKEIIKMPKIYFSDSGLRNLNISDFRNLESRNDKGTLTETFFYNEILKNKGELEKIRYWRTKTDSEVDFIIIKENSIMSYEIKFKNQIKIKDFSSSRKFCNKYSINKAFIITKEYLEHKKVDNIDYYFIPLWMI